MAAPPWHCPWHGPTSLCAGGCWAWERHQPVETQQWGRWYHLHPLLWLAHFAPLCRDQKISCSPIPEVVPKEQKSSIEQNVGTNPPGQEGSRQWVGRYSSWRELVLLRARVNLALRSQPWADPSLCFRVPIQRESASSQRTERQPQHLHFCVTCSPRLPEEQQSLPTTQSEWACLSWHGPCVISQPLCNYKTRHPVIYVLWQWDDSSFESNLVGENKELKMLQWKKS